MSSKLRLGIAMVMTLLFFPTILIPTWASEENLGNASKGPAIDKQTMIDNIKQSINSTIPSSISDTSTKNPWSATYVMVDSQGHTVGDGKGFYAEVTNYTFYLPVKSFVSIESSGYIANFQGSVSVIMGIDNIQYDYTTYRDYLYDRYVSSYDPNNDCNYCWSGFQTSRGYYLNAGYHTVRLYAAQSLRPPDNQYTEVFPGTTITVIANKKGDYTVK